MSPVAVIAVHLGLHSFARVPGIFLPSIDALVDVFDGLCRG
jgi:hypothetical protein